MNASHKAMIARIDAWLTDTNKSREETMACQETMDVFVAMDISVPV
jgi:hypothetical protein